MNARTKSKLTCDDAVVGFITVTGYNFPWTLGEFTPGPEYAPYAAQLERERELNNAAQADGTDDMTAHDSWLEALESVNELCLRIDGSPVRDFKIDSRGKCEFKFDHSPSTNVAQP